MVYLLRLADYFFSKLEFGAKVKFYAIKDVRDFPKVTSIPLIPPLLWTPDREIGKDIAQLNFTLSNKTIIMGDKINWAPAGCSKHWLSELHGFEWLTHLKVVGLDGQKTALYLVENWMINFNHFSQNEWKSKTASIRLCSFLTHNRWLIEDATNETKELFFETISKHAQYLKDNICWYNEDLDIIKNIKAIIFSACCLYEFRESLPEAIDILKTQLEKQVLPDGFHYSRNPSNQTELFKDIQEIIAILNRLGCKIPPFLIEYSDKIASALMIVNIADGVIANFGENQFSNKTAAEVIQKIKIQPEKMVLNYAGFSKLSRGITKLVFYSGSYGLYANKGHKTADICSFNLSVGNKIVFTNIKTAPAQHYLFNRTCSTDNQTAIEVNRENSVKIVNNKFKTFPKIKSVVREEDGLGVGITASHNGYKKMDIIVSRTVFLTENGDNVLGEDIIKTKSKNQSVKSYFQVGLGVSVKQISEKLIVLNILGVGHFNFSVKNATMYLIKNETIVNGLTTKTDCIVIQGIWNRKVCKINWALSKLI